MKRYKRNRVFFLLITGILIAAGLINMSCKGDNIRNIQTFRNPIVGPTSEGRRLAALTPLDNCDELLAHLKNIAIEDMDNRKLKITIYDIEDPSNLFCSERFVSPVLISMPVGLEQRILKEDSDQLKVIGQVGNIAPKEDIRSMRFDGSRPLIAEALS